MTPTHTPTLGESLDHYGEEYCTRAVNAHEELLSVAKRALESCRNLGAHRVVSDLEQAIARAEEK